MSLYTYLRNQDFCNHFVKISFHASFIVTNFLLPEHSRIGVAQPIDNGVPHINVLTLHQWYQHLEQSGGGVRVTVLDAVTFISPCTVRG